MENQASLVGILLEKTERYAKSSIELMKLKAVDKSAEVASTLAARLVVFTIVALAFFMLNIGLSLWLGELLGKSYYGFLIVAGFYGLCAIVLFAFRNTWIKKPVKDAIITQALN